MKIDKVRLMIEFEKSGLTREELAKAAQTTPEIIGDMLNRGRGRYQIVRRVAERLGLSPFDLIRR